ncbi:cobalamin-dependent protein, partial [bacterium]|nr:cobalamin-dependent protein [bacterium]
MKILLIRPPYTRLRKTGQAPYFPLGLGYIASIMKKNAFTVGIYNGELCTSKNEIPKIDKENIFYSRSYAQKLYLDALKDDKHMIWNEISNVITDFEPDIIGISLLSVEVGSAFMISKIAKGIRPEITVVWGGVHPTFLPEECLKYKEVDYLILGEGENIFLDLVKGFNKQKKDEILSIDGLAFIAEDKIKVNPPSDFIEDLDSLPFPARETLLNYQKDQKDMMGSIITSRGCPYRCSFCSSKEFWHRKVRTRSAP